jgi:protocatechuate 3,4-dioxygenase beta subunit
MKAIAAWIVLLGAAVAGLSAQPAAVSVQGRVITADGDSEPIAHARIVVYDEKIPEAVFFAGNDGRFAFVVSSARRRRIVISKTGYAPMDIALSASTLSAPFDVRLQRGGTISGRVLDARGEPYSNATINLIQPKAGGDVPTLKTVHTDDLGEYRLWGIAEANDYIVELALMQRDALAVWYPGADNIDRAERITIREGSERTGIDFVTDTTVPLPTIEGRATTMRIENDSLRLASGGGIGRFDDIRQPLTGGSGVIRGRVILPTGTPLSAATVTLASTTAFRPPRSVSTDTDGRFTFDQLPAGEYLLGAAKTPYVSSDDVVSGAQVRLADGEIRSNIDFVLTPPAAITGRVLDEFGEPYEGAMVTLLQTRYEAGRRRLVGVASSVNPTDDRGRYRIINVPPGRYFVAAAAGSTTVAQPIGDVPGYALTYFPAAVATGDAQPVDITGATTAADLDMALVRTPTARISGRVVGSNPRAVVVPQMTLETSYRSKSLSGPSFTAFRQQDGRFEFRNVPPGDYVIQASSTRTSRSTEGDFAAQFVTVTGTDVTDVVLQAAAGSTIAGRVIFDGRDPPAIPDFGIVPEGADLDLAPRQPRFVARAELHPDLTFVISGVHGPRRIVVTESPGGWTLKSVFANGVDVTDRALPFGQPQQSLSDVEVLLTDRLTELDGTVTDSRGDITRKYTLLVFSTDRDRWYPGSRFFRRAAPDANGSFTLRGLPPGNYQVAPMSVADVPRDGETAWQDPEFLESIAGRSTFATLTEGQKTSISARLLTP